jgi:pimeloyl-ACP methyl ester carboxylesterase
MLIPIAKFVTKVVPDSTAVSIVRGLAAMTTRPASTTTQRAAMAKASKFHYGEDNKGVAWSWGEGPLVVFVHGWGGRAAQMAPLASHVSTLGFRSVALDITGHGESPKRHTRWSYFIDDISALSTTLQQEVYAYVGHSAGALSVMAARSLKGVRAKRFVCICAPSYPFPPINVIAKKLGPRDSVMTRYKDFIAKQFQTTWELLETGVSYADAGPNLLLLYDETDRFVSHTEGDRIKALCPGSQLRKTNQYSHQRSLEAPEVVEAVSGFLLEPDVT